MACFGRKSKTDFDEEAQAIFKRLNLPGESSNQKYRPLDAIW